MLNDKMIYNCEEYTIKYNECDKNYIEDIIKYLDENKRKLFEFFKIKKLKHQVVIEIVPTVEDYSIIRNGNMKPSSVGNARYNDKEYTIYVLTYEAIKTRKGHENAEESYVKKLIAHEFVHICEFDTGYFQMKPNSNLSWVTEGLACYLSGQYSGEYEYNGNFTLDDLLNNVNTWYCNYYNMVKYVIDKYGNDYMYKIFRDEIFRKEETIKIYNDVIKCKKQ